MIEHLRQATVGHIVAADFRTARVFERFGIDFCCGGRRSLEDACRTAAANPDAVAAELEALPPADDTDADVTQWSADRLVDHIVSVHHTYVRAALPTLERYLAKLVNAHGSRHPELARIAEHFDVVSRDLKQHMMKEEHVLFPYVRALAAGADGRVASPFGTVRNPIRMMEQEHRDAADELRIIRALTNDYTTPDDGCTTYAVCMAELERFERDLHRHVHLENNVLFPKAVAMEHAAIGG